MCGFQNSALCLHWTPFLKERGAKDIYWVQLCLALLDMLFQKNSWDAWLTWIDDSFLPVIDVRIASHSGFGQTMVFCVCHLFDNTSQISITMPIWLNGSLLPIQSTKAKSCNSIFEFWWTWHFYSKGNQDWLDPFEFLDCSNNLFNDIHSSTIKAGYYVVSSVLR